MIRSTALTLRQLGQASESARHATRSIPLALMRALNEHAFFPYRYAQLTKMLSPFLSDVRSVLDVGASCGRLARRLMNVNNCNIVGIDVCVQPHALIPVRYYDGQTFPFADSTFDCVMMVDMLHHTENIEQMIDEARRVSRRYILIKDHYWETELDQIKLRAADYTGNAPYGIPLPNNFLRMDEWTNLFDRNRLGVVGHDVQKLHPLDPCKHLIVKLQIE